MIAPAQDNRLYAREEIHPTPDYRIVIVGGKDITSTLQGRLESLTLTDNRGFDADQLDITLDDSDGMLDLPPRGAKLSLALGWKHEGLVDKGTYTVDEVEHSGSPDKLVIRARSADLRAGLTTKRERSFHGKKVADIVSAIASQNRLTAEIAKQFAEEVVDHIDQTSESDANLLTRLAEQFDAIATVKHDRLMFIKAGEAKSASGLPLGAVTIVRSKGDQHRFTVADGNNFTAVKAYWQNTGSAKKGEVLVDAKTVVKKVKSGKSGKREKLGVERTDPIKPSAENTKVLRHTYASEVTAIRGAKAAFDKLQRGVASFSITLAHGRADLFPELPAIVSGWKPTIDGTDWIISQVSHSLSDSGFTTQLDLELKIDTD